MYRLSSECKIGNEEWREWKYSEVTFDSDDKCIEELCWRLNNSYQYRNVHVDKIETITHLVPVTSIEERTEEVVTRLY